MCVVVFLCVCTIFRFLIACASARAKKKYQAYKYGTLTQGYGIRWAKGGDIFFARRQWGFVSDMTPVSLMQ